MKYHHIFGPVLSRRLGISLGIDLVAHKICSLDCIYCECGKTTDLTIAQKEVAKFEQVKAELNHFWSHNDDPDYITFSGSGEPTLNPCLGSVIDFIKENKPNIKVAVLTNSTLMHDSNVRAALMKADRVVPSLDAAVQETFEKINRPHEEIEVEGIINGLETFSKIFKGELFLEVFILPGINDQPDDIKAINDAIQRIKPLRVQLNTLDRPGTLSHIQPASREQLESIICRMDFKPVEIIARVNETIQSRVKREDIRQAILETIHRRPCTKKDLVQTLGVEPGMIDRYISELEDEKKIQGVSQKRGVFYHTIKNNDELNGL